MGLLARFCVNVSIEKIIHYFVKPLNGSTISQREGADPNPAFNGLPLKGVHWTGFWIFPY